MSLNLAVFGSSVVIFSNLNQRYLHQMLTKLHDSKTYFTQFFMYFQPMITIFPNKNYLAMLKFDLMLITTLAFQISISHNIFCIPSCPECQKVLFYSWNHVIWSSFDQDTVQKPTFPYFLPPQVLNGWFKHLEKAWKDSCKGCVHLYVSWLCISYVYERTRRRTTRTVNPDIDLLRPSQEGPAWKRSSGTYTGEWLNTNIQAQPS